MRDVVDAATPPCVDVAREESDGGAMTSAMLSSALSCCFMRRLLPLRLDYCFLRSESLVRPGQLSRVSGVSNVCVGVFCRVVLSRQVGRIITVGQPPPAADGCRRERVCGGRLRCCCQVAREKNSADLVHCRCCCRPSPSPTSRCRRWVLRAVQRSAEQWPVLMLAINSSLVRQTRLAAAEWRGDHASPAAALLSLSLSSPLRTSTTLFSQ